jgi:hypothetical protein
MLLQLDIMLKRHVAVVPCFLLSCGWLISEDHPGPGLRLKKKKFFDFCPVELASA